MRSTVRTRIGAIVYDWLPFEWHIRRGAWLDVRNRRERLVPSPAGRGVECSWLWSSDLHISRVFPSAGRRLLLAALDDWPVRFANLPSVRGPAAVTFVIGHRGAERIPHLLATLATIAGQEQVACEAIVVEQDERMIVKDVLPAWVRHIHTPPPRDGMPYSRAWALNVGIRSARAPVVVPSDNDLLMPARYAAELLEQVRLGAEIVDLKRFVFYLGRGETEEVVTTRTISPALVPETVTQNLQGGTMAGTRSAFESIGAFDESFVGWGGEDNELWERAAAVHRVTAGYLPFVHLWHAPQPGRIAGAEAPALLRYRDCSRMAIDERIEVLRKSAWGSVDGPAEEA